MITTKNIGRMYAMQMDCSKKKKKKGDKRKISRPSFKRERKRERTIQNSLPPFSLIKQTEKFYLTWSKRIVISLAQVARNQYTSFPYSAKVINITITSVAIIITRAGSRYACFASFCKRVDDSQPREDELKFLRNGTRG